MLDPKLFTEKTKEALAAAHQSAVEHGHARIEPLHLLQALTTDSNGLAARLLTKAGAGPLVLSKPLADVPRQTPAPEQVQPSPELIKVLTAADADRKTRGDSHVATESVLLALLDDKTCGKLMGIQKKALVTAIEAVRQGRTVDSEQAENRYEALEKYGRDLVAAAKEGKLNYALSNPATSNQGFMALLGVVAAAGGKGEALSAADVDRQAIADFLKGYKVVGDNSTYLAEQFTKQQGTRANAFINYESWLLTLMP